VKHANKEHIERRIEPAFVVVSIVYSEVVFQLQNFKRLFSDFLWQFCQSIFCSKIICFKAKF